MQFTNLSTNWWRRALIFGDFIIFSFYHARKGTTMHVSVISNHFCRLSIVGDSHDSDRMASMKRAMIAVCMTVLLVSCSSKKSGDASVACDQQFWNGTFATCLPKGWKVLSKETMLTLGVPEETIAAFQVQDPNAGQFDTVTVTREPLATDMTTTEYSNANVLAVSALPDYRLIDKTVVYIDAVESALHVFSARPSPETPIRRYYQVSAAKDRMGYTFTGSFPLSVEDAEAAEVEFILKNASLTDPTAKTAEAKK
jgi:hypothetical protein